MVIDQRFERCHVAQKFQTIHEAGLDRRTDTKGLSGPFPKIDVMQGSEKLTS